MVNKSLGRKREMNTLVLISKEDKNNKFKRINNREVILPQYVTGAYKRYSISLEDEDIVLYTRCNICKRNIKVAKLENETFVDVSESKYVKFKGPKSGYADKCNECTEKQLRLNSGFERSKENVLGTKNKIKVNFIIEKEKLKEYKILAIKEGFTFTGLILEALEQYKESNY